MLSVLQRDSGLERRGSGSVVLPLGVLLEHAKIQADGLIGCMAMLFVDHVLDQLD